MSFILTKLSEIATTDSLDNIDNFIIEQDDKIKKINKEHINVGNSGSVTEYGYFGLSENRLDSDGNLCYYAFFDLEGNEVDNIEVVKAFNKGVVRCVNPNTKNGRHTFEGYCIKEIDLKHELYVTDVSLGEIDSSFTDIWSLPIPEGLLIDTDE